jgi:hypothetical protein
MSILDPNALAAFWGPQFVEHAQLLQSMLVDPASAQQASQLAAQAPQMTGSPAAVQQLAQQLNAFCQPLLAKLNAGQWLGFAYPSIVQHMIREHNFYLSDLAGQYTPAQLVALSAQDQSDALGVLAKWIDPSGKPVSQMAQQGSDRLAALVSGSPNQVASAVQQAGAFAQSGQVQGVLKIVSPMLAAHDLREGKWYVSAIVQLQASGLLPKT